MMNMNSDDTQPIKPVEPSSAPTQPIPAVRAAAADTKPIPPQKTKVSRWPWILLGFAVFLVLAGLGVFFGYQAGIQRRLVKEAAQVSLAASEQFERGMVDYREGRYEAARRRFEYVLRIDPNFPGAMEKFTEVQVVMMRTATPTTAPTAAPTSTPTPPSATATPDTRGADTLFQQAKGYLAAQDWTNAIVTLDLLRQMDLQYHTVEVDGMYYVAYRYRGVKKIMYDGDLEPGIFDLAQASHFGPLDYEADSFRTWASYYITGASFWEVNWEQVVYFYSFVAPAFPNMHDGNGWTASERYRVGLMRYGNDLAARGEFCKAQEQYTLALQMSSDPVPVPTANWIAEQCIISQYTPTPEYIPPTETPTPTPTGEVPLPVEPTPTETLPPG